jgi:hypothetical protein
VTNSHISNVEYGSIVAANNMLLSGNEIDHFGDDGVDYNASNILITRNYIHDNLDLADGATRTECRDILANTATS